MMTRDARPRVAFLFFSAGKDWLGGKNYYRALFGALNADPDPQVRVFAFFGRKVDPSDFEFPSNVTCVQSSTLDRWSPSWLLDKVAKRLLGRTLFLPRILKRQGIDVVSHCDPDDAGGLPSMAWIADFQHVHLPRFFPPEELAARDAQFERILRRADRVIVSSASAGSDLNTFSPQHAGKERVLRFCAVRPTLDGSVQADEFCDRYGLKRPFFYLPNQFWAHKNHRVAIEALASLTTQWPDLQIACSGALSDYRNPTHIDELRARIDSLGLNERFKLLGLIPYPHIAQLMVHSAGVLNPSYFEGWSTTVEEAKSLGVSLILSDLPVHREQCPSGEARFFPADDSAALARCLEEALVDAERGAVAPQRLEIALAKHQQRTLAFARAYQLLVKELVPR